MRSQVSSGSLLREARRRAAMSQVELGNRAGVTQSVISAYESGSRQPSLVTLERLVAATGLELDVQLRRPASRLARLSGPLGRRVRAKRHEVRKVVASHGLANVRVFGSVSRGEESPDSDVDLLVDVPDGIGLFDLARAESELEALLEAKVDLVPSGGLKPDVAPNALAEAIDL